MVNGTPTQYICKYLSKLRIQDTKKPLKSTPRGVDGT